MQSNSHLRYRPDIDGLRAVAIVPVVAFHANPEILPGGFTGVDIFFVISGYLISGIILKGIAAGHFSFREFYARRIKRILPALVLVLSASWLFGAVALLPSEYSLLGKHIKAAALFVSNFTLAKEAGYFDTLSELKPLLHLWSLAVEEQFYLIWPVLLVLAARAKANVRWLILVVLVISFLANLYESSSRPFVAFFLPHVRFWELAVGGLLAHLQHMAAMRPPNESHGRAARSDLLSIVGFLMIMGSFFLISREASFPGWRAAFPVLGTALLISAGPKAFVNRIVLSHRAPVFIGLISYPLYLWHWPLFAFAKILAPAIAPIGLLLLATVAFLLAWLTYRYVEIPVRSWKPQGRRLRSPAMLFSALIVIGLIGAHTRSLSGYLIAERPKEDYKRMLSLSRSASCSSRFVFMGSNCLVSSDRYALGALIVGDSHANRLFRGLSERLEQDGVGLLSLSGPGCLPLANTSTGNRVETNNCLESINQALGIARNHPEIKTVYLAARWAYYTTGQGYGLDNTPSKEIYVNDRRGTPAIMEIKRGLVETLAMLRANGKRVVFVHDAPELSFDPAECSPANEIFTVRRLKDPCGVPLAEYRNRQSSYRAWAEQVLRENQDVGVIDPESTMCTEGFCFAKRGSDVLYSDSHHLNTAGSRYLMQRVEQP